MAERGGRKPIDRIFPNRKMAVYRQVRQLVSDAGYSVSFDKTDRSYPVGSARSGITGVDVFSYDNSSGESRSFGVRSRNLETPYAIEFRRGRFGGIKATVRTGKRNELPWMMLTRGEKRNIQERLGLRDVRVDDVGRFGIRRLHANYVVEKVRNVIHGNHSERDGLRSFVTRGRKDRFEASWRVTYPHGDTFENPTIVYTLKKDRLIPFRRKGDPSETVVTIIDHGTTQAKTTIKRYS